MYVFPVGPDGAVHVCAPTATVTKCGAGHAPAETWRLHPQPYLGDVCPGCVRHAHWAWLKHLPTQLELLPTNQ